MLGDVIQAHLERDLEAQGQLKQQAGMEKQRLSELLQERNRPSPSNLAPGETIYLLSREFLNLWKRFIRSVRPSVLFCPGSLKAMALPLADLSCSCWSHCMTSECHVTSWHHVT